MKPKKATKQRPNVHMNFQLSDNACSALSDALIFMLCLKDFSFDNAKINYDSASAAQAKLFDKDTILTRGEVRATAMAIDLVLQKFSADYSNYIYMEEEYPGILADLQGCLPTLKELHPTFILAVKDLRKLK